MVGMTRFELATPATRTRCATRLRYIPTFILYYCYLIFNYSFDFISTGNSKALPLPLLKRDI